MLLPGRLWKYTWDPEGLLSTLPAIGSGLIGMCAGYVLLKKDILENRLNQLFFIGFLLLIAGDVMQWFFPLNKNLWSSSFTLFMGGIGMISLAAFSYYFDVKQSRIRLNLHKSLV